MIDALLDTERTLRKPQYIMAPEIPLVLQSCEFDDLKFTCSFGILNMKYNLFNLDNFLRRQMLDAFSELQC